MHWIQLVINNCLNFKPQHVFPISLIRDDESKYLGAIQFIRDFDAIHP